METGTRNRQTPRETLPPSAGISDLRSRGFPRFPPTPGETVPPRGPWRLIPVCSAFPRKSCIRCRSIRQRPLPPLPAICGGRVARRVPRDRKAPIGRDNGHRAENVPLRGERGRAGPGSWRRRPARLRRRATRPPPGTLQDLPRAPATPRPADVLMSRIEYAARQGIGCSCSLGESGRDTVRQQKVCGDVHWYCSIGNSCSAVTPRARR